ncbi:MAG: ATP synthase subunit I [Desulfocurvibacter africanus]
MSIAKSVEFGIVGDMVRTADIMILAGALAWGVLLCLLFYGGLWLTLRSLGGKGRPRRFLWLSFLARLGLTAAGFWAVLQLGLPAMAAALLSFSLLRLWLVPALGRSLPREKRS